MAGMTRFYDPHTCPDCGAPLADDVTRCPACRLPLTGELAQRLGTTLRHADDLLGQLRALARADSSSRLAGVGASWPAPAPASSYPVPPPADRDEAVPRGLRPASVPAILLGLGAVCLIVAAAIFLAVAWSWLGVGGRTAVLLGLTATAVAASRWLGARGLWLAAEALTAVALGMLLVDLAGARAAGWLGGRPWEGLPVAWYGVALAAASLLLMVGRARLVVPQLAVVAGTALALVGLDDLGLDHRPLAAAGALGLLGLVHLGVGLRQRVLPWFALVAAACSACVLGLVALEEALRRPDLADLWVDGRSGWWLLVTAALCPLPATAWRRPEVLAAGLAAAGAVTTVAVGLVAVDEEPSLVTLVALVGLLGWSAVAAALPRRWSLVPLPSMVLAAVPVLVAGAGLLLEACWRVLTVGEPFSEPFDVRLPAVDATLHPGLFVPVVLGLHLAVAAVATWPARLMITAAVPAVAVAGVGTLALLPVPLWTVTATLVLLGAAVAAAGSRGRIAAAGLDFGVAVAATALLVLAVLSALPNPLLASLALLVTTALAGIGHLAGRTSEVRVLGGVLLPLAVAGLAWSAGEVAGFAEPARGVVVLLLLGGLAIARPLTELEVSAAVAGVVAAGAAIPAAVDEATALAVHLTVAGAVVSTTALVNRDRRLVGWLGGALLATATWVRLADLGVTAPEPYTLPSAVALLLVGLRRLHTDASAATLQALLPGLSLATVPTLLWALVDPVSVRAAVLGLACLALVLLGGTLRWSAPLLVGACVGGALVLREAAPYAAATPQWVLIGGAGTVLTVVGVTWERRLLELRRVAAYVARLR